MMNTTRKTKVFRLLLLLAIVLLSLTAYRLFYHNRSSATLNIETFGVPGGWGYQILIGEKVFIYQPIIPGIPGNKPFPDRKSALGAAKLVAAKLKQGKRPSLSRDDILKIGLDSLGNSH